MQKLTFIVFISLITLPIFAKGGSGEYFISGNAYFNNELLKDEMLIISFKDKVWKVETNASGKFEIEIEWNITCASNISKSKRDSLNSMINPKWISIFYKGKTLEIENLWKKYAILGYSNKSEVTRKLNLNF